MQIDQKQIEHCKKALSDFAAVIAKGIEDLACGLKTVFAEIAKIDYSPLIKELGYMLAAYEKAKAEHPRWVHMANYSKKKRIRKKYYDRIMRTYGKREAENEQKLHKNR